MFKLLGAIIVITVTTYGGFFVAKTFRDRPKELRILQQALQMIETEIVYGSVPLDIIMEHIGNRIPKNINLFFLNMSKNLRELDGISTYECWEKAINNNFSKTTLKKQDKEVLMNFGQTLGISDREDQMKNIKLTLKNLSTEEILAREEQKTYEGLSKNLGILLGLLIVIMIY